MNIKEYVFDKDDFSFYLVESWLFVWNIFVKFWMILVFVKVILGVRGYLFFFSEFGMDWCVIVFLLFIE